MASRAGASGCDQGPRGPLRPSPGRLRLVRDEPHQLLELVSAVVAAAVDEERRRAVHPADHSAPKVVPDLRGPAMGVEVAAEPVEIEPGTAGIALEVGPRETVLVLEDQVVHLPELSLRGARFGGFGGELCVGMQVREREVPESHPHQVARQLLELLEDRVGHAAVGALEVPVLDQGHRRSGRTPDVVVLVHRTGEPRLLIGSHGTSALDSSSSARRIPSAPGFTPTGETWLQRTIPSPSITNSARSGVPSPSRYARYSLATPPFGSTPARGGDLSLRSAWNAVWHHTPSTEMPSSWAS